MSYIYRSVNIGQSATPTADLMKMNTLRGLALAKGDPTDNIAQATNTTNTTQHVGWFNLTPVVRCEPISILPHSSLVTYIPPNARILSATLKLKLIGRLMPGSVVPGSGTNFVQVWPVRRVLDASLTGLTWVNWYTASAWAEYGILFGTGADSDSTYLDRFEITQADYDAAPSAGNPVVKDVDLTTELQRVIDFTEPLQLAFKAEWAQPTATSSYFTLSQPSGDAANPHSYIEVAYRRPREFYQAAADGTLDQTEMLDATSESLNQHLWLGAVAKGSASSYEKFYLRNEMSSSQPAVTIVSGRATIGSIDNSGVVGSGRVLCIRVYDNVAGVSATPTGVHRLVFTSATLYDHKFTPDGSTTESTVSTGNDITTDEVLQYSALNALSIKSVANGGAVGTFAAADVVTFETRGDLHTTTAPKANLDDYYLAPHSNSDRESANSAVKRSAANAFACQLNLNDTRVVANSGGSSNVCVTVTDGSTYTHIKVPDPMIFAVDGYATLATYNSLGDPGTPGSSQRVATVQIKAVYDINDATYPGQIRLYETLSTPSDFGTTAVFTTGIWIGTLSEPDQQTLSADASTASPVISLTAALTATSGVLTLLDITTGTNEQRTIASVLGSTVTLTAVPSYSYPRGSLVFFAAETASNRPFYCQTTVPAAATKGRKRAYVTSESWAVI